MKNYQTKIFTFLSMVVLLTFVIVACSQKENPETQVVETPIQELNTPTPELNNIIQESVIDIETLTPEPEEINNDPVLPEYSLKVEFDYSNQSARVNQTILYVNNSKQNLSDIRLATDTSG